MKGFYSCLITSQDNRSAMVVLKCPIPGCEFKTDDVEAVGAAAILNIHAKVHDGEDRAPKLERPIIKANGSCEGCRR